VRVVAAVDERKRFVTSIFDILLHMDTFTLELCEAVVQDGGFHHLGGAAEAASEHQFPIAHQIVRFTRVLAVADALHIVRIFAALAEVAIGQQGSGQVVDYDAAAVWTMEARDLPEAISAVVTARSALPSTVCSPDFISSISESHCRSSTRST